MGWTVAIGVDTHKDVHVAVAFDALGVELGSREVAATEAGYGALLCWAREFGVPAFAVEGCGSYGAGLARFLELGGVAVWECERPRRRDRRRGKSDLIDAAVAGRRLLAGEGLCLPRGGGRREDLRLLLLERRSAIRARTATLNQLSALVVTAPADVRRRLGALSGERLARAASRQRSSADVTAAVLRRLGRRVEHLSREVAELERTLAAVVSEVAPDLLSEPGVDPSALRSCSSRAAIRNGWQAKRPSLPSPAPAQSRPQAENSSATGSTAVAIANSTGHYT